MFTVERDAESGEYHVFWNDEDGDLIEEAGPFKSQEEANNARLVLQKQEEAGVNQKESGKKETDPENSVLKEADKLCHGDRQSAYGHPIEDYTRTAKMWSAILGVEVTAKQASLCMCAVKISRECHKPKRDNLVDLAGYAEVASMIERV